MSSAHGHSRSVLKLFDYLESGNGYKVRLALRQLGIGFELIQRDILKGETRTDEFLELNPNGRIPVLLWPDGRRLWESNAILWHLARNTELLPSDAFLQAQVMQWMCFEQYSHEPYIATVRFWTFSGQLERHAAELEERRARGYQALGVMNRHLQDKEFFVNERYSIADIALYAYTHVASEGGYELDPFPAVVSWLSRVRSQAGHIAIDDPCPVAESDAGKATQDC